MFTAEPNNGQVLYMDSTKGTRKVKFLTRVQDGLCIVKVYDGVLPVEVARDEELFETEIELQKARVEHAMVIVQHAMADAVHQQKELERLKQLHRQIATGSGPVHGQTATIGAGAGGASNTGNRCWSGKVGNIIGYPYHPNAVTSSERGPKGPWTLADLDALQVLAKANGQCDSQWLQWIMNDTTWRRIRSIDIANRDERRVFGNPADQSLRLLSSNVKLHEHLPNDVILISVINTGQVVACFEDGHQ